ncbi:fruit protein pKIWI502 [Physcomitrium patens]|uniref:FAD-binding FR-type domain-containing protein n=1 Tax=Physcomitrium patens TaxID=3218 RepID=A0A2K1IUL2_PHYPA|nr:fruit protein pKIWI502-like [Physcomitrium patens]PNR32973.1 hypothetical protein PHYPA_024916 [Physcomitrium patens]|eukprot:XP_024358157.1 fruit protein pKIWI502-like [Physcomitrella patens]
MATTAVRCVAAGASAQALRQTGGYGGGVGPGRTSKVQMASSVMGTKLEVRGSGSLKSAVSHRHSFLVKASATEAPAAQVELSAEQEELLQRRKAIMEAEQQSSGFVVTEVETTEPQNWYSAKVMGVSDVAAGVRCITLMTEVSRELVPLENAYVKPGNIAQIRLDGKELTAVPSSPPFSMKINMPVLYKLRGDIPAGMIKLPQFSLSVKAPVEIHVEEASNPELYTVSEGQELEVGPYLQTAGLDLRPILTLSRFPTIVFFARGRGLAVARAIVEAIDGDVGSMSLSFREEVRLFCSASKPSELAYQEKFADWESRSVKVRATVDDAAGEEWQGAVGSFRSLWDEDDLEYDPNTTAAIVCVEEESRKELTELLEEAGIPKEQILSWKF